MGNGHRNSRAVRAEIDWTAWRICSGVMVVATATPAVAELSVVIMPPALQFAVVKDGTAVV